MKTLLEVLGQLLFIGVVLYNIYITSNKKV